MVLVSNRTLLQTLTNTAVTTDADDADMHQQWLIQFITKMNFLRTLSTGITPPTGERREEREWGRWKYLLAISTLQCWVNMFWSRLTDGTTGKDSDTKVLNGKEGGSRGERRVRVSLKEAAVGIKAEMRFSPPKKWWGGCGGGGVGIFQAREREVPRNPDGWQKESSLKRRKGRFLSPVSCSLLLKSVRGVN